MTDTPVDPQDVVIKPPPATVYAKANVPIGIVMTVRGTVERLTADGASDQAIVEAIRQESPELAEVVEANTPKRPQGIDAHEWIRTILAVYMAILVTYATLRAEASLLPWRRSRGSSRTCFRNSGQHRRRNHTGTCRPTASTPTTATTSGSSSTRAPNLEAGDVVILADGREALVTARVEARPGPFEALLQVVVAPAEATT